jgi:alpha-1,3-rhamnosyl/mannosyltransferase
VKVVLDLRCLETPSGRRGIGRYAAELAQALPRVAPPGWSFASLSFAGAGERLGLEDLRYRGPRRGIGWADRFVLPPLLRRARADVYHATAYALPAGGPLPAAPVLTVHDLVADVHPAAIPLRHRAAFRRTFRSAARAARVIAVSECTRRDLLARYPGVAAGRVVTVLNGTTGESYAGRRDPAGSGFARPYLLYVGGLDPLKNAGFLLPVLERVRRSLPGMRLVIAGEEGPRREALAAAARAAGLEGVVEMAGYLRDVRLATAYREATAFLFPSRYEGFGLPPLEAMGCGCPVVSSPAGSLEEVLGGAALLRSPDDPAAWADAIRALVDDGALRGRLVAAGRARAAELTWERTARRTLEVYAEAARAGVPS